MTRVNFRNSLIALAIGSVVVSCGGGNSNKQSATTETKTEQVVKTDNEGVVVNGVKWAFHNAYDGRFRENQIGPYYTFDETKTVCPKGWRLPTKEEFESLVSTVSVWNGQGREFADGTLFFRADGCCIWGIGERTTRRKKSDGSIILTTFMTVNVNEEGTYWSSDAVSDGGYYVLRIDSNGAKIIEVEAGQNPEIGYSCRCVAE